MPNRKHLRHAPRKFISARVPAGIWNTLEQAAEFLGTTVNKFVVQTANRKARHILDCESVIRLSHEDAQKILTLLGSPPKPNRALKDTVKKFNVSVRV
jgi:uncharacterized protein (DUF1778 family)